MTLLFIITFLFALPKLNNLERAWTGHFLVISLVIFAGGDIVGIEAAVPDFDSVVGPSAYEGKTCHLVVLADHHYVNHTGSIKTTENLLSNIEMADIFYSANFGFRVKPLSLIEIGNGYDELDDDSTLMMTTKANQVLDGVASRNIDSLLTGLQGLVKEGLIPDPKSVQANPVCAIILMTARDYGTNLGISENSGVCRSLESGRGTGVVNVLLNGDRITRKGEVATFLHVSKLEDLIGSI